MLNATSCRISEACVISSMHERASKLLMEESEGRVHLEIGKLKLDMWSWLCRCCGAAVLLRRRKIGWSERSCASLFLVGPIPHGHVTPDSPLSQFAMFRAPHQPLAHVGILVAKQLYTIILLECHGSHFACMILPTSPILTIKRCLRHYCTGPYRI